MLFERFVSRERNEPPDIDIDFEHERREEVLQYIYGKYGRDRAGMTAEVISYRPRSAVRDVGKALGLSLDRVDALAKTLGTCRTTSRSARATAARPASIPTARWAGRWSRCRRWSAFPRHLSPARRRHGDDPRPAVRNGADRKRRHADRTVIEWDKDDLDALGILKVDCLSLGMLTAIRKCFDWSNGITAGELTLANIPPDDPAVYE